jgi:hypothetical protein
MNQEMSTAEIEPMAAICERLGKLLFLLYSNRKKKKGFILKDVILSEDFGQSFYVYDRRKNVELTDYYNIYNMISSLDYATVYDNENEAEKAKDEIFPVGNVCRSSIKVVNFGKECQEVKA